MTGINKKQSPSQSTGKKTHHVRPVRGGERPTRQQSPTIRTPSQRLATKLRDSTKETSSVTVIAWGGMREDSSGGGANAWRPETTSAEHRMPRDFRPQGQSPHASTGNKKMDKKMATGGNHSQKNASKATANHHGTSSTNNIRHTNETLVSEVKSEGKKWVLPTRPAPSAPPLSTCPLPAQPTKTPSLPSSSTRSRPGAYRVQGRGGGRGRIHSTHQQHCASTNDEITVPTAFLVEEDDGKIVEAQPMTSGRTKYLLGFVIISILVGIVLGVIFGLPPPPPPNDHHTRESLLELIASESQDNGTAVRSEFSPQESAFEWLWGDPNLQIL